jgi:predicted Kef-type K+ transport protein
MSPFYVDALWLSIAFVCGLLARKVGLPPLVGFLFGGFLINGSGFHEGKLYGGMEAMSDIGVMLLLFTIGLKLKFKTLLKKEIWVTASVHMLMTIALLAGLLTLLATLGLQAFGGLTLESSLMIGFALSFSSTVFVVKILESKGEMDSYHGKLSIGILIIQDIFAVLFIAFSSKELPSVWVIFLPLLLWALKFILSKILDTLEHGEMVPVFGFFATFIAGAFSFTIFGLKPDLGALVIGMMLVNHPRADELYNRMAEYKDFFLIAFFINIGFVGLPNWISLTVAIILIPVIFLKGALFVWILSRFQLQPRTAFLGGLSLTNYSEFGLIVGVIGLSLGLITNDWLVTMALLMSLSFVIAAPLNRNAHVLFDRFKTKLLKLSKSKVGEDCEPVDFGDASFIIVGLSSVGKPAFETLQSSYGQKVLGLDFNTDIVNALAKSGANVKWADATDSELWDNVDTSKVQAVFLTLSDEEANLNVLQEINRIRKRRFKVFGYCLFSDKVEKYREEGFDFVFDYKTYLGRAYVEKALMELKTGA